MLEECGLSDHYVAIVERLNAAVPPENDIEEALDDEMGSTPCCFAPCTSSPMLIKDIPEEVRCDIVTRLPWRSLVMLASVCRGAAQMPSEVEEDYWSLRWEALVVQGCDGRLQTETKPKKDLRREFLRLVRLQRVECKKVTEYRFYLLGCRLCEQCERSHTKYNMISANMVQDQYGIEPQALRGLPYMEGPKQYGLLYLRSDVEKRASANHSSLSPSAPGASHSKRKGKGKASKSARYKAGVGGTNGYMSHSEHVKSAKATARSDPCCFDVSGLELAVG